MGSQPRGSYDSTNGLGNMGSFLSNLVDPTFSTLLGILLEALAPPCTSCLANCGREGYDADLSWTITFREAQFSCRRMLKGLNGSALSIKHRSYALSHGGFFCNFRLTLKCTHERMSSHYNTRPRENSHRRLRLGMNGFFTQVPPGVRISQVERVRPLLSLEKNLSEESILRGRVFVSSRLDPFHDASTIDFALPHHLVKLPVYTMLSSWQPGQPWILIFHLNL
ncbi:hypothetical protein VNO77_44270 [Canavalia gladiata]|uniref:Uncharacterized protein n=1 Tax=Canavalia gladiata TaxID=3824 RepID=A0AAN9JWR2_CANGL